MVKRIIGILATIAVIAIVVFTALNYGGYESMLPDNLFSGDGLENPVAENTADVESHDKESQAE